MVIQRVLRFEGLIAKEVIKKYNAERADLPTIIEISNDIRSTTDWLEQAAQCFYREAIKSVAQRAFPFLKSPSAA